MSEIRSYRDLLVWQKSVEWVVVVYRASAHFPAAENFGLTSQLRRSAGSVPANIAEGHARSGDADYPNSVRSTNRKPTSKSPSGSATWTATKTWASCKKPKKFAGCSPP